jgi:hypothetical protein
MHEHHHQEWAANGEKGGLGSSTTFKMKAWEKIHLGTHLPAEIRSKSVWFNIEGNQR